MKALDCILPAVSINQVCSRLRVNALINIRPR